MTAGNDANFFHALRAVAKESGEPGQITAAFRARISRSAIEDDTFVNTAFEVGDGEAAILLILEDLELAEHQLRGLKVAFRSGDRENEDFASDAIFGAAPDFHEAAVGQLASQLMESEIGGQAPLHHFDGRDHADGLRAPQRVGVNVRRNYRSQDDDVGATIKLRVGDRNDRCRVRAAYTDNERKRCQKFFHMWTRNSLGAGVLFQP